jgi:hypothetical protein
VEKKSKIVRKGEHVTWKALGDNRSILLDLNSGRYFSLNETATAVWQLIVSDNPLTDIGKGLSEKFEENLQDVADDVQEMVGDLISKGLVSETEIPSSAEDKDEQIQQIDFSHIPYTKPQVQEHEPIKQVTAATGSSCGSHYWWPN